MPPSVLVPILALACALGCAPERRVEGEAHRIVSLTPALTEILIAVGAGAEIVGLDRYSRRIPGMEEVPSLGALFSPDLERTIELAPSLVVAEQNAQQRPYLDRLRSRGVSVETFDSKTLADILQNYERLGALVGRAEAGRELRQQVVRGLAALEADLGRRRRLRVAVLLEREPLYVVGGASYVSALIEAAGGRNVFADLDMPYPSVSLEALAERAPEVLIDTAADPRAGSAAIEEARAFWGRFDWVGRVEVIPQGVVTLPGPRLVESARVLSRRIYPEPAEAPRS